MTDNLSLNEFSLHIGGKERRGLMTMTEICRIEEELDHLSLMGAMSNKKNGWGFNVIATVLWVGLQAKNPQITKKHITTWITNALNEGADLADFVSASQRAVLCGLGVKVRSGASKALDGDSLPDVDGGEEAGADAQEGITRVEDAKRPLGKSKGLHTA